VNVFGTLDTFLSLALAVAAVGIVSDGPHVIILLLLCRELRGSCKKTRAEMQQIVHRAMQTTMRSVLRSDNRGVMALSAGDPQQFVRLYSRFRVVRRMGSEITSGPLQNVTYEDVDAFLPGDIVGDLRTHVRSSESQVNRNMTILYIDLTCFLRDVRGSMRSMTSFGYFSSEENRRIVINFIHEIRARPAGTYYSMNHDHNEMFAGEESDLLLHLLQNSYWVDEIAHWRGEREIANRFPRIYGIHMTYNPADLESYVPLRPA
jgi:hypothetical protein